MSAIDWSKAPPHATYWCPGNANIEAGWIYNPGGNGGEYYSCYADKGLEHIPEFPEWRKLRLVPRPSKATGQYLPAAGTVCEWKEKTGFQWVKATVLFITESSVVLQRSDGFEWQMMTKRTVFRPFRTPEQIKADERLHDIRNACNDIARTLDKFKNDIPGGSAARNVIEAMIDAGYRKFEITDDSDPA